MVPGTAPQDLELPARRALRILLGTGLIIIFGIPVYDPFPYIPGHIVEPPGIRLKRPDRCRVGKSINIGVDGPIYSKFLFG